MRDHSTSLRPVRPEYSEGLLFARYLDEAAEGFFGFMLGRGAQAIMASAFIYLQSIAVKPDFRGAGIGSLLMNDVEERARACVSARLSLDVSAKNKGARKLYARRGMSELSEWPSSRLLPTIFVRMAENL
jgi:ribosomal protein S18 acetylase RimI-like enzyme